MVFFVIVFLAFLATGLYLTVLQEQHKRSKGISVEYDSIEEIEKILKEKLGCPFVKEISINKKGNIEFVCKYGSHAGVIQDGKFFVDKLARKFSSHREIEESWYLQKYIERVFYSETEEGKEKLELKFTKYIKIFNISRIIKYIVILCVVVWIFCKIGGMDSLKSKGVSQMYFTAYGEDITIGEALKATCSNCKWSSNKGPDNLYYVTFNGNGANGSLLTIVFETNGNECSIESMSLNGEDITLLQTILLESIYENARNDNRSGFNELSIKESVEKDSFIAESEDSTLLEEELQYDTDGQMGELETDSEEIAIFELGGHYSGLNDAQSVLDFSVYTEDSDDGSIGIVDLYVEGGQYTYNGEVYEISTNLYAVAVDTGEEVLLAAYESEGSLFIQLYVNGEYITEYASMYSFQS